MKRRFSSLLQSLGRVPAACWVVLVTLPALVPLARPGLFLSDDGLIHAYRLAALDRAVRAGVLYPRWFPEFAFGYGHPVLNFYGPLSYYWGLPFTLAGLDAVAALKVVFAAGLVASALAMYLFARQHLDRGPSVVAAAVYAYLPYHLVDLYVRGALAEFMASVWVPLVLWSFGRLVDRETGRSAARLGLTALLLAALVATHSLSALIFAPVLALYLIILLAKARDLRAVGRVLLAAIVAAGVSAFHWLPVLVESRYVGLGYSASQGYQDHLLPLSEVASTSLGFPYLTESSGPRTFPLGVVQLGILVAAVFLLHRLRGRRWPVVLFLSIALLSAFMLTTASLPVWRALEGGLALLQYPWRFQLLTALATGFLAGALVQGLTKAASPTRFVMGALLVLATMLWSLWRLPTETGRPDMSTAAMWQRDQDTGQIGATWTGEYLPIWVQEQRWAISRPSAEPVSSGAVLPAGQVQLVSVAHTRYDLNVSAPQPLGLTLHQFHYPGWQGTWLGETLSSEPVGVLGLATFEPSGGEGRLTARLALTAVQLWGTLISLGAALACAIVVLARLQLFPSETDRPLLMQPGVIQTLLVAACYLLLAAVLIASLLMPNGYVRDVTQTEANLENHVELLGYRAEQRLFQPGDTLHVELFWRSLRAMEIDFKSFVHVTDQALTEQAAQHDGDPGAGFSPTTRWVPGEIVPDRHDLVLPTDLQPGRYRLWAGMYDYGTVRNLVVVEAEVPYVDDRILLGEIEVAAP